MGFTTPAFILKNTPELRKELEELGYAIMYGYDTGFIITNPEFGVAFLPVGPKVEVDEDSNREYIDCGTNEDLFLAIAALRDDTDKNQWFVLDHDNIWEAVGCYQYKGDFILCNHDRWYCGTDVAQAHKATVKELQELFSQKIQVPQIEWNINDVINKD